MEILLSIIIPVYNAEYTINKCIDSILNNKLEGVEIIIINDGSTDNSLMLCKEYQSLHGSELIKIIDKKNSGPSDCRNLGIEISKGKYISFIDSDDYVSQDYTELIIKEIVSSESEIIFIPNRFVKPNGEIINDNVINNKEILDKKQVLIYEIIKSDLFGYSSSKCILSSLVKNNKITMPSNIRICEDLLFTCRLVKKASKISIINEPIYYYVMHENSLSRRYRIEMKEEYEIVNKEYFTFLIDENIHKYDEIICEKCIQTIITYMKMFKEFKINGPSLLKECKWVMNTFTYNEVKKYSNVYKKVIKGKKKIPILIALKINSPRILKVLVKVL